jgi:hypothetical protein
MVAFPPELPLPPHFRPNRLGEVWRVPYQSLADAALQWSQQHALLAVGRDRFKVALIAIDVQNTFCIPEFELFVAGRSGKGALDDTRR